MTIERSRRDVLKGTLAVTTLALFNTANSGGFAHTPSIQIAMNVAMESMRTKHERRREYVTDMSTAPSKLVGMTGFEPATP